MTTATTTYPHPLDPELTDWLTIREAADRAHLREHTVREYMRDKRIPHTRAKVRRPGGRVEEMVLVRLDDVENYRRQSPAGRTEAFVEEYDFFRNYCGWGDLQTTRHLARLFGLDHGRARTTLAKRLHARQHNPER